MTVLALIDGPLPANHPALHQTHVFRETAADSPAGGHASALAASVLQHAPELNLINLVVFGRTLATDAATVAAALTAAYDADLVLCAFGLARDDEGIRSSAFSLLANGACIIAAAPARGGPVFPAALPGVIAVQGDARCEPDDWSLLGPNRFGACPVASASVRGASAAAAHLAGHLASFMTAGASTGSALDMLRARSRYKGPERRLV